MKRKLVVQYISIIFIIATFMGSLHHHNDMQEHNDCKVCTIQHNIVDIDTPVTVNYVQLFTIASATPLINLQNSLEKNLNFSLNARAPPSLS